MLHEEKSLFFHPHFYALIEESEEKAEAVVREFTQKKDLSSLIIGQ